VANFSRSYARKTFFSEHILYLSQKMPTAKLTAKRCLLYTAFSILTKTSPMVRPPDILVGGLMFYRDSSSIFYLLFFVRYPPSSLNGTQPEPTSCSEVSKCDLKMHVRNMEHTIPLKIGAQNHVFRRFRNLAATLAAYIFRTKYDIHNQASAYKGSPTSSQNVINFDRQTA